VVDYCVNFFQRKTLLLNSELVDSYLLLFLILVFIFFGIQPTCLHVLSLISDGYCVFFTL